MEHFEVEGPEKEHIHHEAIHNKNDFATKVAVLTACLATIGAIFNYAAGKSLAESTMLKNEAAIVKTEAANQWAYYQSKSTKQAIMESSLLNANNPKSEHYFQENIIRYKKEKIEIKKQAEKLEEKSNFFSKKSDHILHIHHRWAEAIAAIQIAISLAAMSMLTKKQWLFIGSFAVTGIGIALGIFSFLGF
jgi:hypothetical protein